MPKNSFRLYKSNLTYQYCFTEHIYNHIKSAGAAIVLSTQFLFMFNFDHTRTGYYHELEAYGEYTPSEELIKQFYLDIENGIEEFYKDSGFSLSPTLHENITLR
ncbi:MAG: hypothetical protein ACI83O_000297 [Patescibacteria group bacterium]|jgi:hypothetical protein